MLHHRDKQGGAGAATGKKMCTRVGGEVPISFGEVCMIYPAPQIVARSDLVCPFTGLCFPPAAETKDEWTYRGYYGVSSSAITIGLVDSDNPLPTEGIL